MPWKRLNHLLVVHPDALVNLVASGHPILISLTRSSVSLFRDILSSKYMKFLYHCTALHYVHFVKYDDAVSFYDTVSDTIRRRGENRGIFTEEGVDTVAYFGGNHGSRV